MNYAVQLMLIGPIISGAGLLIMACSGSPRWLGWPGIALIVGGYIGGITWSVSTGDYALAAFFCAALAAVLLMLWSWWRRKRKAVKAALGEKSRALREALARRLREVARPSPVLRPSLGGAR